jgi:hypothetical protein
MKLLGEGGNSLQLEVVGYQCAGAMKDYWEANWLIVRCKVGHPRGSWSFSGASLATFELERLARWFDGVADGNPDAEAGYFTESHLTFLYAPPPAAAIEVRFAFEAAPPWMTDRNHRLDGAVVSFPLVLNDPTLCAHGLRDALARFPPRGEAG